MPNRDLDSFGWLLGLFDEPSPEEKVRIQKQARRQHILGLLIAAAILAAPAVAFYLGFLYGKSA